MKKGKTLLILSALLIVLLGGAGLAYSRLSTDTAPESVSETEQIQENQESQNSELPFAPDFTFLNADGEEIRLADLTGKPVLLNFWATWCPPCREEMPHFEKAYSEYGETVQFLMMNETDGVRDTVDSAKEFREENSYTFPVYFDTKGEGARAYSVLSIPLTVFLDAEGRLVYQHIGALTEEELFSMLERQIN
ncbi:MAG: redoxin domain-containing protein [Oscillospiraceae bacterium]|nr:redoxin domain-containing protein [Oscillospiraceae bacterium]